MARAWPVPAVAQTATAVGPAADQAIPIWADGGTEFETTAATGLVNSPPAAGAV